jgi:hypothetical protein
MREGYPGGGLRRGRVLPGAVGIGGQKPFSCRRAGFYILDFSATSALKSPLLARTPSTFRGGGAFFGAAVPRWASDLTALSTSALASIAPTPRHHATCVYARCVWPRGCRV